MTVARRAVFLSVALLFPVVAWAAPENAQDWFVRMQKALAGQSYSGVVVYEHGGRPLAYRLVVANDGYAVLKALSGAAREIVRGPHVVIRLMENGSSMVIHGGAMPLPFPPATQTNIQQLSAHYRMQLAGWDRIAGERTRIIALVPRDRWRYGYRLWVGQDSGLPLRSELISSNGDLLQQAFFTQLNLISTAQADSAIGPEKLTLIARSEKRALQAEQGPCSSGEVETLDNKLLPPGFNNIHTVCEDPPAVPQPVTHFLVSDGLTTISVFVTPHHDYGSALVGSTELGAVHAVGIVQSGFSVTVMGDAPFPTISDIAHSVTFSSR